MATAMGSSFPPSNAETTSFRTLKVEPWRQFTAMDLDLSRPLTIITGANGTGKTTLLNVIGVHFNWNVQLIGTPFMDEAGSIRFKVGSDVPATPLPEQPAGFGPYGPAGYPTPPMSKVGSLIYENDVETELFVPDLNNAQFTVSYQRQQYVDGVFLNSHRSISGYQLVSSYAAKFPSPRELYETFLQELRSQYFGFQTNRSAMLVMKEALLAAAIFSEGNSSVIADSNARAVWEGFQKALGLLLPPELGFERLIAMPPEILVVTRTGSFAVDALSGGLRALFELTWQISLRAHTSSDFTVCIDEPENHLHPEMQRSLMPNLMKAYPNVKFIIATHSPFIVRSSDDARVYALGYDAENRVEARLFDPTTSGLSPEDTLRDVLGLDSTIPIWAERRFNDIVSKFTSGPPTAETLGQLKKSLIDAGLSSELPSAVDVVVSRTNEGGQH
ncbi:AAA family ATPase [Paenarthrobacter aurescens]|jgi:hypothetical protein|uniref:ATPase AAA-type core domain-containing protein n=1 Tax=Paenarthrobacter aurescens (strain TC1) TaxID=290340 RepID=A1R409_PAEAT|nr:AAA family ATPase [Paenarthrobacter aurescens]ABM08753.1 hypothetical protein AAur_1185 [Paenarthrobacter aurescens TC1]